MAAPPFNDVACIDVFLESLDLFFQLCGRFRECGGAEKEDLLGKS